MHCDPRFPTPWRPARRPFAALVVLVVCLWGAAPPTVGGAGAPFVRVLGQGFALGATRLPYVHGVNYEGPGDRPWHMWATGAFSPTLIAADLDRAALAGYDPIRIFVQAPLPALALAGDFSRLDAVVALARARGLHLLLTFNDDRDPDLARVARVDGLIAAHFAAEPVIFGYDVQNEPGLAEIATALYPTTTSPLALRGRGAAALIARYGEQVSLARAGEARRVGDWTSGPFGRLNVTDLYLFLNMRRLLLRFQAQNPTYPLDPISAEWRPFVRACNQGLAAYLAPQVAAIRAADHNHMITVGYNDTFWAGLPANSPLDFRSIHLYPAQSYDDIHQSLRLFVRLHDLSPTPLLLEEYGFSAALVSPQAAAVQEMATELYLRLLGGAGDLKWMLNDIAVGASAYENNLGVFTSGGGPKPIYFASRAASIYFGDSAERGGLALNPAGQSGLSFLYAAPDALAVSGAAYSDRRLSYATDGGALGQLWLSWAQRGRLRLMSTQDATVRINLPAAVGAITGTPQAVDPASTPWSARGPWLTMRLQAGVRVYLNYRVRASGPPAPPVDLPAPPADDGWYIISTGHTVRPPFLAAWLHFGGVPILGAPLTEPFIYHGLSTQFFGNVALRRSAHGVYLVPLGLVAVGGSPLPAQPPLHSKPGGPPQLYVRRTGHTIAAGFLRFYQRTGGAAVWGDPLSDERQENGQTVQYFTNAAFVWDNAGRNVVLAPLGWRLWPSLRDLYGL